jgi:ribosomal protein S17
MKLQLLSTKNGMKSSSLKRLALSLSKAMGYKVWRTTKVRAHKKQLRYGDLVDKLTQYKWFQQQGLSALDYTTSLQEAQKWFADGNIVFGRLLLNASCGDGIVVFNPSVEQEQWVHCPVYTKYKKKKREFRVHVFRDTCVAIVEKKRKSGWNGQQDTKIRNLANGYIFCQEFALDGLLKTRLEVLSLAAAKVSGSDFKGVDIGYNEKNDDLFVIEVNSAPGIEGSNVDKYVKAIVYA